MSESRSQRVKEIFDKARGLPRAEREAFVRAECDAGAIGNDAAEEALSLLDELDEAGQFLETPVAHGAAFADALLREATLHEGTGSRLGPYKLLEVIGEGGFGVVYMAEQEHPIRRRVALKVIKLGMDTRQVIARFEQERQALAMMDHPNIAKVLDAGATPSGRPYFVMELVRGLPITQYCDERRLGVRERLAIFSQVCEAVQHAHQKGIIHRDIKPSNVLVTIADGERPMPKVIDFGIAKATQARLTEKTLFTEFRQIIGTPEYMSPEQAGLGAEGGADIDTRSDVYSLGVLLYELLTGVTPFDSKKLRSAAFDEMRRIIREVDPPRPSTRLSSLDTLEEVAARRRTEPLRLRSAVRGELDWIVMRCLEKERVRRYAAAADIAKDIARHLANEPLEAGPPGAAYRVRTFMRRHRRAATAGALVLITLVLGLIGTTWGAFRAMQARDGALEAESRAQASRQAAESAAAAEERQRKQSQRLAYRLAMELAAAGIDQGNVLQVREALANAPVEHRGWEWSHLSWVCDPVERTLDTPPDTIKVACTADGKLVFTRALSGEVRIFAADTGQLLRTFVASPGDAWGRSGLVPNHDGSMVLLSYAQPTRFSLWNAETGEQIWSESSETLCGVSFSGGRWRRIPDGAVRLGLVDDHVLDTISFTREEISQIDGPIGDTGNIVVTTEKEAKILWNMAEGRWLTNFARDSTITLGTDPPFILSYYRDGIRQVNARTGTMQRLDIPTGTLCNAGKDAFGVESQRGIIQVYSLPGPHPVSTLLLPRNRSDHAISPDGSKAYIVEAKGVTRAVQLGVQQPFVMTSRYRGGYAAAVCPTGRRTVTVGWGSVCAYDAQTGEEIWSAYPTRQALYAAAFTSDGTRLAVGGRAAFIALFDASNGDLIARIRVPEGALVTSLAWSPSGDRLLAGCWDGSLLEFDPRKPSEPPAPWPGSHSSAISSLEFSCDGARVLSASQGAYTLKDHWPRGPGSDNSVRIHRAEGDHESRVIHESSISIRAAVFSPDAETIAISSGATLSLLAVADGRVMGSVAVPQTVRALAFNPDGTRLAAIGTDDQLRVFAVPQMDQVASLRWPTGVGRSARFSPDGKTLLACDASTPVIAYETEPPSDPRRRALVTQAAKPVVEAFLEAGFVSATAQARLQADRSLSPEVRAVALDMARARGDDPNQIYNAVQLNSLRFTSMAEWETAATKMKVAVGVLPDDLGLRLGLGMAQLRAGRSIEAIESVRMVVERAPESAHERRAYAWAVLAMARWELGEHDQANEAVANAVRHLDALGPNANRDLRVLVTEARQKVTEEAR